MDDLKTSLEHLSSRVEDRPDAFVRLERRRHARALTRRLMAGVVGLGIAVVGTVTAYSVITTPTPRGPGAANGRPIAALWPEHDTEELRVTQEAVDSGDSSLHWRLDAEETAVRFVHSVLGWTSEDERLHHNAVEDPSGLATVEVVTVPASCDEDRCDVVHDVIVQLRRLGKGDGVWSVISAESPVFNMQFRVGQAVHVGQDLEIISGHPSGSEIAVGVKLFGPCSGFHRGIASVHDYRVSVAVIGLEEGCLGYVYALTPPPAAHQDQLGQSLFDREAGIVGETIDEVAVAPVFIVASDGSGSSNEGPVGAVSSDNDAEA
jgi:hypothetical protein